MPLANRSAVTTASLPGDAGFLLLRQGRHAAVQLFRTHVFLVGGRVPAVAEGIFEAARAVAVELVRHRSHLGAAGGHGLFKEPVDVGHIEEDAHGRAAVVLRPPRLDLGMLVGQHDHRVADLDLGMTHPVPRTGNAHELLGPECALVEIDGPRRAVHDQVRGRAVVSVRNGLDHVALLCRAAAADSGRLVSDLDARPQLPEHGDGREVGELPRARIFRWHVLDLDGETPEVALDGDAMLIALLAGPRVDLDPRLLRPDAGRAHRGNHVDVGGESLDRLRGRTFEDEGLRGDGPEVDVLALDPRRAREPARRLARLHDHRGDAGLARALHAVEPRDGPGGNEDTAAVLLRQPRPLVEHTHEAAHGQDHEAFARREHGGGDLTQRVLGCRLDDQIRCPDEPLEPEGAVAVGPRGIAHGHPGEGHAGYARGDSVRDLPADDAHAHDADIDHLCAPSRPGG